MTPERWVQVEALFHRALVCEPQLRAQVLEEAGTTDPELRREVESLLSCRSSANIHLGAAIGYEAAVAGWDGTVETRSIAPEECVAEPGPLGPGTIVGPYQILELAGQGGMGFVYRAVQTKTGELAAIKTVPLSKHQMLDSIRREIYALSRICHPGIVRILDQGVHQGLPWYAMELVQGRRLSEITRQSSGDRRHPGRKGFANAIALIRGICTSLSFLHGEGIVHCDLKPDNVLIGEENRPVIIDFGLAKQFEGHLTLALQQASLDVAGTAAYISPEMIRGETVDARADLYALGCIMYELFAGSPPFTGDLSAILNGHLFRRPPPLVSSVPEVPRELSQLVQRLLTKDPAQRLGYAMEVAAVLENLGATDCYGGHAARSRSYVYRPTFQGRQDLVRGLLIRMAHLQDERGGLVVVSGESGVGKTRFLSEVARQAAECGLAILTGECVPDDRRALGPLRGVLQHMAARCRRMGEKETERLVGAEGKLVATYEPEFAGLPGQNRYPPPAEAFGPERSLRVYRCIAHMLVQFANEQPLLLILDDMQWADELTAGLVQFVLDSDHLQRAPILVLISLRSDEMPNWAQALADSKNVQRVRLGRLSQEDVAKIAGDMLAIAPPPNVLGGYLYRQSEGNPFFVAEYLRMAAENGILTRSQGTWQLPDNEQIRPDQVIYEYLPIPSSLLELIQWRLRDLSDSEQLVLSAAAVLGRENEMRAVAKMTVGLTEGEQLRSLNELVRRRILEEINPGTFRFSHDKLREVAYDCIPAHDRRRLHHSAALAIESLIKEETNCLSIDKRTEEKAGILANHYNHAEMPEQALHYFRLAGNHALGVSAHAEAISYYEAALKIAGAFPVSKPAQALAVDLRLELQIPRMHLYGAADDEMLRQCREAEPIAEELGDPKQRVLLYRSFGSCLFARAQYAQCTDYNERCLALARSMQDQNTVCTAAYTLAIYYLEGGRLGSVEELVAPVIVWLEDVGPAQLLGQPFLPYVTLTGSLGVVCTFRGDCARSDGWHERSLKVASDAHHHYSLALAHVLWGWSCYSRCDGAGCRRHGDAAVEVASKAKLAGPRMMGLYNSGIGAVLEGSVVEGIAVLNEGLQLADTIRYGALRTEAYFGLAQGHLASGDLQLAAGISEQGLNFAHRTGELKLEPEFHMLLAEVAARRRKTHLKQRHLDAAAAIYKSRGMSWALKRSNSLTRTTWGADNAGR